MNKNIHNFDDMLNFIRFTHLIQKVKRVLLIQDEERWENDAEHCYQLALVCWYVITHDKLTLDTFKVIGMALVHDVVEAYAGDTYIFDEAQALSKKQREADAIAQIQKEFPHFISLHALINEYEKAESNESRFVQAMDKLIPVLNIYLDNGRLWRRLGVDFEKQLLVKKKIIPELSKDVAPYFYSLFEILKNNPLLFDSNYTKKPTIEKGIYQHYKGNLYEVVDVALNSETREKMILYRALYETPELTKEYGEKPLFTRPAEMFLEKVLIGNNLIPRFEKINDPATL